MKYFVSVKLFDFEALIHGIICFFHLQARKEYADITQKSTSTPVSSRSTWEDDLKLTLVMVNLF